MSTERETEAVYTQGAAVLDALRFLEERNELRRQLLRLARAIGHYRYWFDTCTRTLAPKWEDRAAAASEELDAALGAMPDPKPLLSAAAVQPARGASL